MSEMDSSGMGSPAGLGGDDLGDLKVKKSGGPIAIGVILALLILGAAGAGIWYGFLREDPAAAHETFRREIFGVTHARYYQAFWKCAMTAPEENFTNNTELISKIMQNSGAGDATRYAEHLQKSENCLPLLATAVADYRAIKSNPATPPEYGPLLDQLADNVQQIQKAWTDFAEYEGGADKRAKLRERVTLRGEAYAGYEGGVQDNDAARRTKYQAPAVSYFNFLTCVIGPEPGYTSFEGDPEGEDAAHYKLVAHIDGQCAQNRDALVVKIQETCYDHLFPATPPEPTKEFEEAVAHWVKQGGDYGSAIPIKECLEEFEELRTKELVDNIAKSWYAYRSTYRDIFNVSKSKSTSFFDRGRTGSGEAAEGSGGGASE